MQKLLKDVDLKFILTSFFIWRALLYIFQFISLKYLSLQGDFLGGGFSTYQDSPYLWGWANFDGQHYLSIVQNGYKPLTYFFFPVYPTLVGFIGKFFGGSALGHLIVAQLISNLSLIIALIGLWKLIKLDWEIKGNQLAKQTILLLLLFPTSFYFAGAYTESLFLALVVWSFYFAKSKNWFWAGILGGISTATRIVGLALLPALLAELWAQRKGDKGDWIKRTLTILLVPAGLFVYMYYLQVKAGDPLEFLHSVEIFGQQRSSSLISLPQVFYRYIFKVLPNVDYSYLPVIFTTWLEFMTAVLFGGLGVLGLLGGFGKYGKLWKLKIKKLPLSYGVYLATGYLIPTLSGSFSSLPRYVLVLFPAFILGAIYLNKVPKAIQILVYSLLLIGLGVSTSLFLRGYWVA